MTPDATDSAGDGNMAAPLRRVNKEGKLYVRPAEIEAEISAFLPRPLDELVQAITTSTPSSSCLLHFVRRFRPNGRSKNWDAILMTLLDRIDRQVRGNLGGIPEQSRDEVRERVRASFLQRLQKDDDSLDIFEARFALAVKTLTIDARRALKKLAEREISIEELGDPSSENSGHDALDAIRLRSGAQARPEAEARLELGQVLQRLTPRERQAVIAVYQLGLKEHSSDPDETTAATLLGVGDRMVRYLLASARKKALHEPEISS